MSDLYGEALKDRLQALERVFGKHKGYFFSFMPFYLGGGPTLVEFPNYLPGAIVYTTSEMTGGWGSGQKPGKHGEYEFLIVVPRNSALCVRKSGKQVSTVGLAGSLLTDLCKRSTQDLFLHGETTGPVHPSMAPMCSVLFVDITSPKHPFSFGGATYGLLLIMLITEAERTYLDTHGSEALIKKLREAKVFPLSDIKRKSVV